MVEHNIHLISDHFSNVSLEKQTFEFKAFFFIVFFLCKPLKYMSAKRKYSSATSMLDAGLEYRTMYYIHRAV